MVFLFYRISFFLDFRSSLLTRYAANRDLIGDGNFVAIFFALPFDQLFNVLKTVRNRTRSFDGVVAFFFPVFTSRTSLAIGAHSFARLHGIFKRSEIPLIRMEDRPTKTKSLVAEQQKYED